MAARQLREGLAVRCVRTYTCPDCGRTYTSRAKADACEADHRRTREAKAR